IGAYLSDSALVFDTITQSKVKEYLTPQIANNPLSNPLTDTLHWIKVTGSYKANGGEQYIVIGNFKNDTVSHIEYLGHKTAIGYGSYYYIDDVFVTTDSLLAGASEVKKKNEEVKLYPNPNSGLFTVSRENTNVKAEVGIYNMLGEKIYTTELSTENTEIDLNHKAGGLYLYRVVTESGTLISEGKFIIQ
ncbi:MAG TPA: T9SS type A sorting domain-containing protein, partial [Bacteroidia bacterium]|nr:T9SS type A sorting domain-containing protein [Bacteroidia bacterium]